MMVKHLIIHEDTTEKKYPKALIIWDKIKSKFSKNICLCPKCSDELHAEEDRDFKQSVLGYCDFCQMYGYFFIFKKKEISDPI